MTTPSAIHALAVATKGELLRRGRINGHLGLIDVPVGRDENDLTVFVTVSEDQCPVCLIGAASSAFNPHHPFEPGYGYDPDGMDSDYVKDPEYRAFLEALIDELPDMDDERRQRFTRTTPGKPGQTHIDPICLAAWNDRHETTDDDVYALLDRVIEKYK